MIAIRALLFLIVAVVSVYGAADSEGLAFLKKKGEEDGVVTLPSGLMYVFRFLYIVYSICWCLCFPLI